MHLDRLKSELQNIKKDRKYMFIARPSRTSKGIDLLNWECGFPGPNTDLYKNSYYRLKLKFSKDYPFKPPIAKFDHFVYHPNVYSDGNVCLDLINFKWKPGFSVQNILSAIQRLLITPNPKSPANGAVCRDFIEDHDKYESKVRENIDRFHSKMPWDEK